MQPVSIEPKPGIGVGEGAGIYFVDAIYLRQVGKNTEEFVRETVRITLDSKLRGSFELAEVAPEKPIEFCFLSANGAVRLRKTAVPEAGKPLLVLLNEEDIAAIVIREPAPTNPTSPWAHRRAYFVPVDDTPVPFEKLRLQVVPVLASDSEWKLLGLSELFHSESPVTSSVPWSGALSPALQAMLLEPVHLEVGGQFSFKVPLGAGKAWLWWLSGPTSAVGVVRDDLSLVRVVPVAVALPPFPKPAEPDAGPLRVPPSVTETEVAENPQIYTEDPGEFCRPFKNPERVLGERSFFVILRAEQPVISAEASVKQDPIVTLVDVRAAHPVSPTVGELAAASITKVIQRELPQAFLQILGKMNRGRTNLDAAHPIQWEGDASRYQATTVARGHILEFRMRWRSNGYSLGTVAKTLTLAPRQTKRVQKIEWRRSELSRREEATRLVDQVSDTVTRERDYQDSVEAHLSEWAHGESASSMFSGAAGLGFAAAGFVIGGGGGASHASTESSQEGGRRSTAAEEQRLRDSIRRYGDSLRKLDSLVVNEVTQEETVTGTTETIRNANYGHSLTVIYYQILRHLKIETGVAGVRECLFVPFAMTPFTEARAYRWRESIRRGLRDPQYAGAIKYLKDVSEGFVNSDVPPGERFKQPVRFIYGSLFIRIAIERPRDKDDGGFDPATWAIVSPFLGSPALGIFNRLKALVEAQRDAIFQQQHAATIVAKWVNTLQCFASGVNRNADFTLASSYRFNEVVRVDFKLSSSDTNFTREKLSSIVIKATSSLPPNSVANVQGLTFTYQTDQWQRTVSVNEGADDLIRPESGEIDPPGAKLSAPPDEWERRNVRDEMIKAVRSLVDHLNEHVEHYHKVIWWNMDRDRLFMLIDGFYIPGTNGVSIASVVERDPIGIMGNAIVFRVSSGSFLGLGDIKAPKDLFNHYVSLQSPSEPMLVSLPTDGLYAQTVMDECLALEEHFGNTDWALSDPDPALGEIAPELLATRRAEPQGTQPTPLPQTLINLQNAPEAPAPSGLASALAAVTNANAFRDMTGLAGTQANAAAAFQAAANLATNFGNQAAALKLAEMADKAHATQTADQKLASVQRAYDKGLASVGDAQQHASKILENLHTPERTSDQPRADAATQAILAASNQETPWTVEHTDALGSTKVTSGGGESPKKSGPSFPAFPPVFSATLDLTGPAVTKIDAEFKAAITAVKANAAYGTLPDVEKIPFIIVALDVKPDGTPGGRPIAGQRHAKEMFFSGSLLKIAAMYAAFELRHTVNRFAATLDPAVVKTADDLFKRIESEFNRQIPDAADSLIKGSGSAGHRPPQYKIIFSAITPPAGGRWQVKFNSTADPKQDFAGHLEKMIVDSHNPSAGFCIQQLGFSWISGLLQKTKLFRASSAGEEGIWLAGDYLYDQNTIKREHNKAATDPTRDPDAVEEFDLDISGWKFVEIPTKNDGGSRVVTNCIDMAKLLVLLHDDELVRTSIPNPGGAAFSDDANTAMKSMLHRAAHGAAAGSMVARATPAPAFTVSHAKIGRGPYDAGGNALSEALIIKHDKGKHLEFVVVWQDVKETADWRSKDMARIRDIIQKTMDTYDP